MDYPKQITVSKNLYPAEIMLRAAYNFIDSYYIHIEESESHWIIHMRNKFNDSQWMQIDEFENELISQTVKLHIFNQTKNIREMLFARTISSAMIVTDSSDTPKQDEKEATLNELDEILVSWFDKNE